MSTALDALGATTPTTTPAATGFSALSAEDFSKIIFTELSKQDPLQPNDTNALLQQISAVRAIQSDMDLSTNLQSLVNQNEFSSAATLIGKTVSGVDENNDRVSGQVMALSRTQDGTYLTLQTGERIKVSNLDQILDTAMTSPTTPPTNPTTPPTSPTPPPQSTLNITPTDRTGAGTLGQTVTPGLP
jgi:flagellar basal-body rod modification protein FlgD